VHKSSIMAALFECPMQTLIVHDSSTMAALFELLL